MLKVKDIKQFINSLCFQTNSCPFCRLELKTDDEAYENFKKEKKRAQERVEDLETLHSSMFS